MKKIISFPGKIFSRFKRLSWKKKIIVVIILIIVFSIALGQIAALTKPPGYTLEKVKKDSITETVTETGNITANGNVEIYSPTNGIVTEVYVENGDSVTEGQELLKVESSSTEQEQKAAYANYLSAITSLNAAKSNLDVLRADMYTKWESFRNLATNGEYEDGEDRPLEQHREAAEFQISQDLWQAAESKYKDQQTVVGQAGASVNSTWLLYQSTQNAVIKATTNGTVANLAVASGSSVKTQSVTSSTSPVLNIANLKTSEIEIALSESDIIKIEIGQKTTVDINAINDKKFNGVVRRVDTIGTNDQGVIRYRVYVEITDANSEIKPGMSADVKITTNELTNTLSVPNSAVKPYQGGRAARIINPKNKQIEFVPVKIGVRGDSRTQIISGIDEGQEVITALSNEQIKRPGLF